MKSTPADFENGAELLEENRKLKAEVAALRGAQKSAQDAFLWAEEKREKARAEAERALRAERDAARDALRELCARVDDATEESEGPLSVVVFIGGYELDVGYTDELRRRGGIG